MNGIICGRMNGTLLPNEWHSLIGKKGVPLGVKSIMCGFVCHLLTRVGKGVPARTSATSGAAPSEIRWGGNDS